MERLPQQDAIVIRGARENNLRSIDIDLPRGKLIVITGPSGSGKSSLAFDTIYAEGQRRYVESLSVYARQFLDRLGRPDVDTIEGLSPAISIEQRGLSRNPRSTVGTVTEIHDYLRLLFARVGEASCPSCGASLSRQSVPEMVARLCSLPARSRLGVLAPLVRGRKGAFADLFEQLRRDGYTRVRVDGEERELGDELVLDKQKKHEIDVYIDRLVVKDEARSRLAESLELALQLGDGLVRVLRLPERGAKDAEVEALLFSEQLACHPCGVDFPELTPRLFSFNNPQGACPACSGLGVLLEFDHELIVPDPRLSLREGAIAPWEQRNAAFHQQLLERVAAHYEFSLVTPFQELPARVREVLMQGSGEEEIDFFIDRGGREQRYRKAFEGVVPNLQRRLAELQRKRRESAGQDDTFDDVIDELERYLRRTPCPSCGGTRLRAEALAVKVGGRNVAEISALPVTQALSYARGLQLTGNRAEVARKLLAEIGGRLAFLEGVGVGYLSLDRAVSTLSGGEAQRVRLATQIGASLVGVLYILDEPSIGLHQRDNARLIATLQRLRDLGNTVLVVEHDEETMRAADHLVDLGPGAGVEGGRVVAQGTLEQILSHRESITGHYLSGRRRVEIPRERRGPSQKHLVLRGARTHNLRSVDLSLPLGRLVCVTGVSGSGKSSLVVDTLLPALRRQLHGAVAGGAYDALEGVQYLEKVIAIDQSPIGRTPRSNPATYTGVHQLVRDLFAGLPEARMRGWKPGRFSFNVKGGRCEACKGDGKIRIEMHFLADMYVTCEVCGGRRYSEETLRVRYRGRDIAEVLALSIDEALDFLKNVPRVREKLDTLVSVGLGYLTLGQPANTLSGGEAQRIKLARELSRRAPESTLYVLDEPTTGLHFKDVELLLAVLQRLVDGGASVLVIEHDLDVIKCADHVIDLGPEGGDAGGQIIATGTPEEVAATESSYTGRYLAPVLERGRLERGRLQT